MSKLNKMKKAMLIGALGGTLLISAIANAAGDLPLWYTNFLKGIPTPAYAPTNQITASAQPSSPAQPTQPSTPVSPTDPMQPTLPPSGTQTSTPVSTPTYGTSTSQGSQSSIKSEEQKLLTLLNQDRAKSGLKALKMNDQVTSLAELKAKDMADNNYFNHTSPTYGSAVDMVRKAGIPQWICGENIAITSSADRAEALFMGSSIHRAAIMNMNYTDVGIGMYRKADGSLYVCEIFIGVR